MSKLTKNIREQMARKLVAYRYTDEAKALVRDNRKLADRVYVHAYTPDVIAAMRLINQKIGTLFKNRLGIDVNAGGYSVSLGGRLHSRWVQFEQGAHEGYFVSGEWAARVNITDTELAEEIKAFAIKKSGFENVCNTAYTEALSVLNTMTTGKKLAEAWPEAMEVIGDLIPEDARTLPVVQVSAINAKFKLPPKKVEDKKTKKNAD